MQELSLYPYDHYYSTHVLQKEKTSKSLVTIHWSKLGEVFSLLQYVTADDIKYVGLCFATLSVMMILLVIFR